jgi:hypothetical protein
MKQTVSDVAMEYIIKNCTTIHWCTDEKGYDYFHCLDKNRSTPFYTAKKVILVFTNNPKWCANLLSLIVGDNTISKGVHDYRYQQEPTIMNALTSYHTIKYNDELDCYEYTIVYPYDD